MKVKPTQDQQQFWKPGTQIAYIPMHANGDINHPGTEFGFVSGLPGHIGVPCRFWRHGHPGDLRTLANDELTPIMRIVQFESVPQSIVDQALASVRRQPGIFEEVTQ